MAHDPTVCIYHGAGCQDGITAAWAVWHRFGDDVRYVAADYDTPPPDGLEGEHVVIVDFSYPQQVMATLALTAASVVVLDHHKTAEADLQPLLRDGLIGGRFDMAHSGARLTWDWFHNGKPVPRMVKYVEDRDLWQFALPASREISAMLASYPQDFPAIDDLAHRFEEAPPEFVRLVREGASILRARQQDIAKSLPQVTRTMRIGGHLVPAANLPKAFGSDACDTILADPACDAPFAAYYFDRADGLREFGLRSRGPKSIDVSEVARMYGGGGHAGAAGFRRPVGWTGEE